MSVRSIVKGPDPRLSQVSEPFDFNKWGHAIIDLEDTWRDMAKSKPFGLAAVQIGHLVRAMIIKGEVMLNPVITNVSGLMGIAPENCLSFPWLKNVKVARAHHGTISYLDKEGVGYSKNVSGFYFRIIQHEVDHLQGITLENHRRRG